MCIQMTQATILNAKKREEKWLMENVQMLCSNGAMAFGDVNDKGSEIKQMMKECIIC
jgi:molybdopterin-containing oxidoreductase family iron-sulfur binding subunit